MIKKSLLNRYIPILCIGIACSGIMTIVLITGALQGIEHKSLDFRFLCRGAIPTNDKIIIVETDEDALQKIKDPFIFWHPYFAEVIKAIAKGGARVIGLDFLQTIALNKTVGDEDLDRIMAEALIEAENVIMINLLQWDNASNGLHAINPLPQYQYASDPDNIGFANLTIDNDGYVRRQTLLLNDIEGKCYAYFGLKVLAKYLNASIEKRKNHIYLGDCSIPVNAFNEALINFAGPSGAFPALSFYKVWQLAHQENAGFFEKTFKDKIVLIGPGNIYSQDFKPTPYYRSQYYAGTRQTPGVEIVANVVNTLLERRFIATPGFWQTVSIMALLSMLISFASFKLSPVYSGIAASAAATGYVYLCLALFHHRDLWIDLIHPVFTIPLTYTTVFAYRYTIEDKEKRRIKKIFKRYVSEEVVDELLKHPGEIALGGHRTQLTVLFADIRGFTSLSDNQDPEDIVSMLNLHFTMMTDIIVKHKGTLDKYIGDGVLAFYGAPIARENHADLAVDSAIEMVAKLNDLNKSLFLHTPLRIGIGIHSGEAVVGNIGSDRKMEYTIIGDTVNIASRVEGLTKDFQADILITGETFSRLKACYSIIPEKEVILSGKSKPVMLYRIEAF